MSKCGAGHEVRTRDIQLGKLDCDRQNVSILAGHAGKDQATTGQERPLPATAVWDAVWDDPDPLAALARVTCGGAS